MRAPWILLLAILIPFTATVDAANTKLQSKMLSDLDVIQNTFEVRYAPAEWKKTYAQWDLEEQINKAKDQILSNPNISVHDYQRILHSFFNSTRDYHVGVIFHATSAALLPFQIKGAEGRYFITWVGHKHTSASIAVGDELISFGGRPIAKVIEELKKNELGNPESLTDQTKAETFLTVRIAALGHEVPQGPISITVRQEGTNKLFTYDMQWSYVAEEIHNDKVYTTGSAGKQLAIQAVKKSPKLTENSFMHRQMIAPFYDKLQGALQNQYEANESDSDSQDSELPERIGSKQSFVPILGQVIWQAPPSSNFHAYLYKTPSQKTIAYVRISDFMGGATGSVQAAREFLNLIKKFEQTSDALVIDQVNNPGGEVFYMYALASMLTPQAMSVPAHRESITQKDVQFALEFISATNESQNKKNKMHGKKPFENEEEDSISGFPITSDILTSMNQYFQNIIDEWNLGHTITSPHYLFNISAIPPHPRARYTKPILVLVNEMAFSCGDFFPAVLQDNKRATIFGTRTAGAGGVVLSQSHPNHFGVAEYTYTGSIAERPNKQPIENLGVTPDIIYNITADDLQNGFLGYQKAVQDAVEGLLKSN